MTFPLLNVDNQNKSGDLGGHLIVLLAGNTSTKQAQTGAV